MSRKIDRYTLIYHVELDGALPFPQGFKFNQFITLDLQYKEEGYKDEEILSIALAKGAKKDGLKIISHLIITKPDLTPEIDGEFDTI